MKKVKVLIVEDNKVTRKLLENTLQDDIFEKNSAENGHEALLRYREWKPDIILLDILLPFVNGYSILKEIRIKEKDTSTIVIINSSLTSREDIKDCAKLGIQGYLVKPINYRKMSRKILEYFIMEHPEKATQTDELTKLLKDKTEVAASVVEH